MRSLITGAILLAATASQASAQVTFSSQTGAPDQGYAPQQLIVDFNNTNPASYPGITFSGNYALLSGSVSGAANPANATGGFFAVPNPSGNANGTAIIDFTGYLGANSFSQLSFYWGSIDQYNSIRLLDAAGNPLAITLGSGTVTSLTGTDIISSANGDQSAPSTNRRVFFDLSATPGFAKLELTSNGRAFEIDDIAATTNVPEPASLALLSVGMIGLAGAARRRRV